MYPFSTQKFTSLDEDSVNGKSFWGDIVKRICSGDAPFGTRIEEHQLIFKDSSLDLFTISVEDLIHFFETEVGLKLQFMYFASWKEIKKKVIKDNIIQDFVNRCKLDLNLTLDQSNFLFSLIHLYLTLKKIMPEDIVLKNGFKGSEYKHTYIHEIRGLHSSNGNIFFDSSSFSDVEDDADVADEDEIVTNHDLGENEEEEDYLTEEDG